MRTFAVVSAFLMLVAACKPGEPKGPVLCAAAGGAPATYSAASGFAGVTLAAGIDLPRPGYTVTLEPQSEPRKFKLMCTAPEGAGADVITEHAASVAVDGAQVGDEIVVKDAQGDHAILVTGPSTGANPPAGEGQACGGIAGIACGEKQYCAKDVGTCQVADSAGVCKAKPGICTKDFRPVCGCDGKTYGNACEAEAAGMNVDRPGECGDAAAK